MVTMARPKRITIDEDVCELIAHHAAAHHLRAEKLQYAETGQAGPIDEERETASEVAKLLKLAQADLDGDEQAAIERLRDALRAELARMPGRG